MKSVFISTLAIGIVLGCSLPSANAVDGEIIDSTKKIFKKAFENNDIALFKASQNLGSYVGWDKITNLYVDTVAERDKEQHNLFNLVDRDDFLKLAASQIFAVPENLLENKDFCADVFYYQAACLSASYLLSEQGSETYETIWSDTREDDTPTKSQATTLYHSFINTCESLAFKQTHDHLSWNIRLIRQFSSFLSVTKLLPKDHNALRVPLLELESLGFSTLFMGSPFSTLPSYPQNAEEVSIWSQALERWTDTWVENSLKNLANLLAESPTTEEDTKDREKEIQVISQTDNYRNYITSQLLTLLLIDNEEENDSSELEKENKEYILSYHQDCLLFMNHYLWKNSFKLNFDGQEILQDKQEIYNKACRDLQTASALTADEVWEKAGKPLGVAGTEAKGRLQKIDLWLN